MKGASGDSAVTLVGPCSALSMGLVFGEVKIRELECSYPKLLQLGAGLQGSNKTQLHGWENAA